MKKSRVVGFVTGAHVVAIGGLLLSQGCGTTRAPLPRDDAFVMPPSQEEERLAPPVAVDPVHRPAPMPPAQRPAVDPVVVTAPSETTPYVVAKGDVLSVIARRYGVSVQEVMRLNDISNPDLIRVGQRLLLPGKIDLEQPRAGTRPRESAAARTAGSGARYVVQAGDSLSVIAQRHGVDQQALMRENTISNPDRIQVGQELVIPAGGRRATSAPRSSEPAVAPAPAVPRPGATPAAATAVTNEAATSLLPPAPAARSAEQTYTVEIGDDLLSVASEFNVSIAALKAANQLDSDILVPGRTLIIPDAD